MRKQFGIIIDTTMSGVALGVVDIASRALVFSRIECDSPKKGASALSKFWYEATQHGADHADIVAVAVASGPGSFTGIKVGLAFAQGLKRAFHNREENVRFYTVSPLHEIARNLFASDTKAVAVVLPATRTRGAISTRFHPQPADLDAFKVTNLQEFKDRNIYFMHLWPVLESSLIDAGAMVTTWKPREAFEKSLACMTQAFLCKWDAALANEDLVPTYLRDSTAEEKLMVEGKL